MSKFKRFSALFCALIMTLSLAACGEEASSSEENSSIADESSVLVEESEASEVESETESEISEISEVSEVDDELVKVKLISDAEVYFERGKSEAIDKLSGGTEVEVKEIEGDIFWYAFETELGTEGYLYGENLLSVSETGEVGKESLTAVKVDKALKELQKKLPDGKYWNHMKEDSGDEFSYTDTPCRHAAYGDYYCNKYNGSMLEIFPSGYLNQCMGFACLVSDEVFGKNAPLIKFYDFSEIRRGDMIRFREYEHSMIVLDVGETEVTLAEVNENYEDCFMSWTTVMTRQKLVNSLGWDSIYVSRYPMNADENGVYSFRESAEGNLMRNRSSSKGSAGTSGSGNTSSAPEPSESTGSETSSETSTPENPESSGSTEPPPPEDTPPVEEVPPVELPPAEEESPVVEETVVEE